MSHLYIRKEKPFDACRPSTLADAEQPKIPQALEMVNQTVSIAGAPETARFLRKNIVCFKDTTEDESQTFYHADAMKDKLRES